MKRLVTALVLVIAASASAFAQGLPVPSGWQNQRGSQMKLYSITPTGDFTGVYFNYAPGFQCQNGPSNPVPYNVIGHASGAAVTFKVVWNNGIVSRWPGVQILYPAPAKSSTCPVDSRRSLRRVNITSTKRACPDSLRIFATKKQTNSGLEPDNTATSASAQTLTPV